MPTQQYTKFFSRPLPTGHSWDRLWVCIIDEHTQNVIIWCFVPSWFRLFSPEHVKLKSNQYWQSPRFAWVVSGHEYSFVWSFCRNVGIHRTSTMRHLNQNDRTDYQIPAQGGRRRTRDGLQNASRCEYPYFWGKPKQWSLCYALLSYLHRQWSASLNLVGWL